MEYSQPSLQIETKSLIRLCKCTQNMYPFLPQPYVIQYPPPDKNRATPSKICLYKHALLLYNVINNNVPPLDWIDTNFQQTFNQRCQTLKFFKSQNYKIGGNILCNRFVILNGEIPHDWLNLSKDTYKVKCKAQFLI